MMDSRRLKQLAGLTEEADTNFSIGSHFGLSDTSNVHKAVDALLEAGLEVDLNLSMGVYYFNFKSEDLARESHRIAAKVIDKSLEKNFD